jgi:hypothetical protein
MDMDVIVMYELRRAQYDSIRMIDYTLSEKNVCDFVYYKWWNFVTFVFNEKNNSTNKLKKNIEY